MSKFLRYFIALTIAVCLPSFAMTTEDTARIAKEAYIYGFPMVVNYKTMYAFAIAKGTSEYKAPFNVIYNSSHLATPKDKTVITPNSDTPYSMLWADLRVEPLVLSVPAIESGRYYSLQFIDLYTYNFAYVGTRTTGNEAGKFLLTGPHWKGATPKGIKKVIHADTDFVFVIYRTQLFNAQDLDNVKKIQSGYGVQTLSQYLTQAAPPAPAKIAFPVFNQQKMQTLDFYHYLNFILQFAPTVPEDKFARTMFAKIGVVPGMSFVAAPNSRDAITDGMKQGIDAITTAKDTTKSAEDLFGTRASMHNDYLDRAVGASWGIYGNTQAEAAYFTFAKDVDGAVLNAEHERYVIHFNKQQIPPVNAFWSVTMYDAKTQLLVANPLHRYLINSAMLPTMHRDEDGGFSIYLQSTQPTKDKLANWLPAPKGPMYLVLRLYLPKMTVLNGAWQPPAVRKI